ncbi:telomere length regulation protein TEL2 homolog isoform X2 [Hypanus sabinus]|uniref:telomere length regulation protein TEL2 homolog isoform X2 n=1 Tax=Hypanus sabinus TaxID=79690 RepID=UPI0028C397E3|nr:telomere length regulation protein TEL2 homolog isoform X2 [Hypanus sabinus]
MFEICAGMSRGRVAANGIGPAESPVFGSPLLVPSGTEILSPMEAEVLQSHSFVRQALGTLSSSRDGAEITHILQAMRQYLEPTEGERSPQSQEFLNMHYPRFLQVLVSNLQADWLQLLPNNQQRELLDGFFLDGPPLHAYLVLLDAVTLASPGFRQNRSVEILERFLREHRMAELIWEVSQDGELPQTDREPLLARIAALPDHMANKLRERNRAAFYPENYYPLLGHEMLSALERVKQRLRGGSDSSLSFVSQLLGKVCIQGHSDGVLGVLVPKLALLTQSDCIWRRICWRLVECVPERWMESVLSGVVQRAEGPEVLSRLLGSIVLKNKKAEFLLTHKLLLLQYHHKTSVLQSLLGYLAREVTRDTLLIEVLKRLLEIWGSRSAVRHSPIEQQVYISKAIAITLGELSQAQTQHHRAELLSLMTGGVDCHLDSSLVRVRRLGMVVAECISAKVDTREYRLTFQYEDDDEVREIRSLCTPRPLSSWESPPQPHRNGESQTDTRQEATESRGSNQTETESELDSDDELVPYDLSADSELCRSQAPVYVGDCLEVLLASDNPERVEGSLKILEDLIRKNPNAAREVSVELTKVLLHLEDKFGIVGFTGLRQRALVALTVTSVVPVTQYLTSEFYAVNYSLSQRMDILDVLVLSAQELAQPGPAAGSPSDESADPFLQVQHRVASDPSRHWKQIIEQRLQNKTRRFRLVETKTSGISQPSGSSGRTFLLPLDQQLRQIIISMGMALLGFTWALRYHPDTYVRQGTLFGFSSLLLTIPSDRLLADVPDELLEARSWLADVAENDPDAECRRLALQNLLLMENLKKNLGICSE